VHKHVWFVALDRRPDLSQLRLEVDRTRIVHARTLSERLSGIDLALTASSRGLDPAFDDAAGEAAGFQFPTYTAALSYNMPIGNKTADYAARRARAQMRAAQLQLENLETQALSEVRQALRDVQYQIEAVRAAEQSLVLARRQLEAEQARYEADLSTNFPVLEFQQSLIEADASARTSRVNYVKALTALEQAQGLIDARAEAPPDSRQEKP
jgi:outer membrane protein TolC